MNYSQVEEISGPSIKIDRRREEPREVGVVLMDSFIIINQRWEYRIEKFSNADISNFFRVWKIISYRISNIEYLRYWKIVISLCFSPRAHSLTQNLGLLLLLKCRSCSLGGYESPWAPRGAIFIPGEIMTRREYWKPFFSQLNQF